MRLAYIGGVNELFSLHFVAYFLPFYQEGNRHSAFLSHSWKMNNVKGTLRRSAQWLGVRIFA